MNNKKQITALVGIHTDSEFDIELLRGPRMKHIRRSLLESVTGEKVMINKCGINTVYQKLYELFEIDGDTVAEMNQKLTEALRNE